MARWCWWDTTTGAALIENNEVYAKLTTANGGTFTWAQLDSVANHVTARSIGDWRDSLSRLAELDVNDPPFAVLSLSVSTWFDTTWIGSTASRLYTGWPKNGTVFLVRLTSSNINRFSKLFHCQNQEKTCNNTITKDPTIPQVCPYTTLWNVKCLKSNKTRRLL